MSKIIHIDGLSVSNIDKAINELNAYKHDLMIKNERFREEVADLIASEAETGFAGAIVSDLLGESPEYADVSISVEVIGDKTLVIADGEDAVWVEFGAGVHYNGSVGGSPNPNGERLGLTIGSYGKGYGKFDAWSYYDPDYETYVGTYGTPAAMPLTKAVMSVRADIYRIAKEVFA